MNKWKKNQKIEVDNDYKETILNSQLKGRIKQWKILRMRHILKEKVCVEEILSMYNTIIREGIEYNQEEYDEMKKLFRSLEEEYNKISKLILDKSEDTGKEIE